MGTVDYRMARRAALLGFRRGFASKSDLCDAHPELMRAARHIGTKVETPCPTCDADELRLVVYTYGKELKRENGRVRRIAELPEVQDRVSKFTCYLVEACLSCGWNHLVRSFPAGYSQPAKGFLPRAKRRASGR